MQSLKIACSLLCVVALADVARSAEEPSAPAQYEFNYAVNDATTGDQKDQQETRNGDAVVGYYRTVDSDGYLRTVKYKADKVTGFVAEVSREPAPGGAPPAPVAAKVVAPAPAPAPVKAAVIPAPVVSAPAPVAAPIAQVAPVAAPVAPISYYSYPYQYGYQPYPYTASYGYQAYPYTAGYGYQPFPYTGYPYSGYSSPYTYSSSN